jgi:hypothetical protein
MAKPALQQPAGSHKHTFDLQISDPATLLNEVARRYDTTERILMEYVDNALDDAESLYRANAETYPAEVLISIHIDTLKRMVTVKDNCRGMLPSILERIVANVGESKKRGITWVNGRFGFGVHAFRAAATAIHFRTKHVDGEEIEMSLGRQDHRGIRRPWAASGASHFSGGSGTEVTVGPFDEEWFETVAGDSIKHEIESHFERLLARPNLCITVHQDDGPIVKCEPFDYAQVPGEDFERELFIETMGTIYPLEVRLKVSEIEVQGREARFFARGRKINEIAQIKSFIRRSGHRTSVWGHPHLLGYIEVGEIVRPVITRDDFDRGKRRTLLYDEVLGLEDDIRAALEQVNESQRDSTLNRLEDVLRDVLQDLAREDKLLMRSALTAGHETGALITAGTGNKETVGQEEYDRTGDEGGVANPGDSTRDEESGENGAGDTERIAENPEAAQGTRRKRSGFDIKFSSLPPDLEGVLKRSQLVDGTIYINTSHPDFHARMSYTRQGTPRFGDRLGAYLAATVSIHYKDQFYLRYGKQPERRDQMFDEQVEFMCRLEAALRPHLPTLEVEFGGESGEEVQYE